MKIVQVISSLANGGAEKMVVELCNELSIDNDVFLISFRKVESWMFPPQLLDAKVRLIELNKKSGFDLKLYPRLFSIFRSISPNVVNVHLNSVLKYIYPLALVFRTASFVHTIHSNFCDEKISFFDGLVRWPFYSRLFKHVTLSANIQTDFLSRYPNMKFFVIENGVGNLQFSNDQSARFDSNFEGLRLISVGSFLGYKNYNGLVRALETVNSKGEKVELIMLGDYSKADESVSLRDIKKDFVKLLGPQQYVGDFMRNSDALVISSTVEGMPLVALESMSLGVPVLSTPVGGLPNLIEDGVNGILFKDFSDEAIADGILRLIGLSNEARNTMRKNAITVFQDKYTMSVCAKKYSDLYQSLS